GLVVLLLAWESVVPPLAWAYLSVPMLAFEWESVVLPLELEWAYLSVPMLALEWESVFPLGLMLEWESVYLWAPMLQSASAYSLRSQLELVYRLEWEWACPSVLRWGLRVSNNSTAQ